jgi:hypothetical protein
VASFTLSQAPWDNGTTVGVYPAVAVPAGSDTPTGTAVTSALVSGGSVTFTGLEERVRYIAYANGRGVRIMVPRTSPATPDRSRIEELEVGVEELEDHSARHPINVMDPLPPYADVARDGTTNDSVAIQARYDLAETTKRAVYWPAGAQPYIAGNILVASGAYTFGDPWATTIKMPASLAVASDSLSSGADIGGNHRSIFQNKHGGGAGNSGLGFAGLVLDGNVSAGNATDEFYFGIELFSVQDVSVTLVKGQNIRGDAIYVGWNSSVESADVHINAITLDNVGVDAGAGAPRQGIAIVQCRRFSVRDVKARRVGGATATSYIVDVEPNSISAVCEDFTIDGIHGYDCVSGVSISAFASASSTGDTTSGTATITNVSPTTGWTNGMSVAGPGISAGTVVLSGAGTSTLTLSARAELTQVGGTFTGVNTRRGSVNNVTLRDGPNNALASVVDITRADSIDIGSNITADVPSVALSSGRTIWLSAADSPTNVTVVNDKRQIQARPATFTAQPNTRYFSLTGSGPVSNGNASWVGHIVTFQCANGVTFTDGGNLKLAGNFAPADGNSTLTVMYDGTNWIELGRSVNG